MGCAHRTHPLPHTCPQGIFWGVSTPLTAQGVPMPVVLCPANPSLVCPQPRAPGLTHVTKMG